MSPGGRRRGRYCSRRGVGLLEPALLLLLHHDRTHGYALLEQVAEMGLQGLDPSIIYRALHDMEDQGWIVSVWDEEQTQGPPRRVYRLTAAGDQVLGVWVRELEEMRGAVDQLLQTYYRHMEEGQGEHH